MPERILYIEDNRAQQMAWEMILTQMGNFKVVLAGDGIEGLEKLDEIYTAIVLDMSLPKMNGLAFLEELHSNEKYIIYRKLPVIVLTVWSDLHDVKAKCDQFDVKLISKEEDEETVVKEIKNYISERSGKNE